MGRIGREFRRILASRASVSAALLALGVLAGAGPAMAGCYPEKPPLVTVDPHAPLAERVAQEQRRSLWLVDGEEVPAWRALIAEIKSAPAPDPQLLALSEAVLARKLVGKATNAEQLALATDALRIAREHHLTDSPDFVTVLSSYVFKEAEYGRAEKAEPYIAELLAATKRHFGEHSLEWAEANSAIGITLYNMGRHDADLAYGRVRRDVSLVCLPKDDPRTGGALYSYGIYLSMNGLLTEALAQEFAALDWLQTNQPTDYETQILVLKELGGLLRNVSRLGEAEMVLRRTMDLQAQYMPDDWYERSQTVGWLGNVLSGQGRDEEAVAVYKAALDFAGRERNVKMPLGASGMYRRWADLLQAQGHFAEALELRGQALAQMAGAAQDHPEVARARLELASTLLLEHRVDEAAALARPAIETVRRRFPENDGRRPGAEVMYARVVAYQSGAEAGYAALKGPTAKIEELMLNPGTQRGDLVAYAPLLNGGFALMGKLALLTARDEEAFRAFQLTGMSRIVSVMHDNALRSATRDPAENGLVVQLQDVIRQRRSLERERSAAIAAGIDAAGIAQLQARLGEVDRRIAATVGELDARYPQFRERARPAPVSLATFRASMSRSEILIMPLVLEDGTYTIALTREGMHWGKSATNQFTARKLIDRLRGSIEAAQADPAAPFDRAAARALYQAVIPASLRPLMASHHNLLWYASGRLASIPPAMLIEDAAVRSPRAQIPWLVRSHAITVLPALRRGSAEAPAARPFDFLGIGAPILQERANSPSRGLAIAHDAIETGAMARLPGLPGAGRELEAMRAAFGSGGGGTVLSGANATKARLLAEPLDRYGVLAFATHALTSGMLPGLTEPALVLTPSADLANDNGVLTASEIAALRLKADWVILSACNTAAGSGGGDSEYSGLASAFVDAGARALLVSHWPVRDDATARLTVATVMGTHRGLSRAEALRQGMLALMADRHLKGARNPAVWAPFVLIDR